MVRLTNERVLLIGDPYRQVHAALTQALPGAHVTSVASYFDGLAELVANRYTAVVAAAEPIERRPEAAVRRLRELAGEGRVVLFGHPTLELLSRKMLDFGVDDYLITPTTSGEIEQLFLTPPAPRTPPSQPDANLTAAASLATLPSLGSVALAEIMLDALVQAPQDPIAVALKRLAPQLPAGVRVTYQRRGAEPSEPPIGTAVYSEPVVVNRQEVGVAHLLVEKDHPDHDAARAALP